MADIQQMPILNRQQLAQFLPTHEAIKAFENLFKYVAQTAPEIANDVSAIIASIRNPASASKAFETRLETIEQQQRKLNSAYSDLIGRVESLEQTVLKKSNNDDIFKRLQNLESIIGV